MNRAMTLDEAITVSQRWLSDTMCLWGLCAKPACRRARECKGEPADCMRRYERLVPEDTREGAYAMLDGKLNRVDFDELYQECKAEIDAVDEWIRLVKSAQQPQ